MPAATDYFGPEEAPTREGVGQMPGPVLLEFGTRWCGFCRAATPRVTALLAQHAEVRHVKVEDGPGQPLGRAFGVKVWPNYVFLRDGTVVRQLARPAQAELEDAFRAVLDPTPA